MIWVALTHLVLQCNAHCNTLPSSKTIVIEYCPTTAGAKISLVNAESRKKIWRNDYYSTIRFQLQGRGGVKWTSSHIKVYRRPLALGDFVESSRVLTHILTRGQVTLFDYYSRSHRFGVQALSSRSRLRTTSMANKNLLVWKQWWEREREKEVYIWHAQRPETQLCVCLCVWGMGVYSISRVCVTLL